MQPGALGGQRVQQAVLDPAVEHRVGRLVDQQWRAELAQDGGGLRGPLGGVGGDPGVQRPARGDRGGQRPHGLLQRGVRVGPVAVEDVHVVQAHPGQRLVQARQQVLTRPPVAVGPWPHVVAGLGRDDQLVAVAAQVVAQNAAEVPLRRAVERPVLQSSQRVIGGIERVTAVVVREIKVGHTQVERAEDDRPLRVQGPVRAKVLPQPQRYLGEPDATPATAAVGRVIVSVGGGDVGHWPSLPRSSGVRGSRGRLGPGRAVRPGPSHGVPRLALLARDKQLSGHQRVDGEMRQ